MPNLPSVSRIRRAVATLIDTVLVSLIVYAFAFVCAKFFEVSIGRTSVEAFASDVPNPLHQTVGLVMSGCVLFISWLYFVQLEASRYRGTPGKLLAGLQVVDFAGEQISGFRATLRFVFGILRAGLICMLTMFSAAMICDPLAGDRSGRLSDYGLFVGMGGALVTFIFLSGKRGRRLQDIFTRTRVTRRGWHPNALNADRPSDNASTSNTVFNGIFIILWAGVLIVPAYLIFSGDNPSAPTESPQSKQNSTPPPQHSPVVSKPNKDAMNINSTIVGWNIGTCSNTTMGATANLLLTVYGVTETTLHGELELSGNLEGGGAFQGTIDNGQVSFVTTVPAQQVAITWKGIISGSTLSGTYVVQCDNPDIAPAFRHQEGVWSCRLVRPRGDPNPEGANSAWVYHDGTEEGPFGGDEFAQRLTSGQWPPNAIVGFNDRTTWSTATACLEKIQAEAASRN